MPPTTQDEEEADSLQEDEEAEVRSTEAMVKTEVHFVTLNATSL